MRVKINGGEMILMLLVRVYTMVLPEILQNSRVLVLAF
jgi:hypothetical protein